MGEYHTKTIPVLITTVVALLGLGYLTLTQRPTLGDPRVSDVVRGIIDAYGGEKALRSVRGYHAVGNQWAVQSGEMIKVERWFGRPDRLLLTLAYPDHNETRLTTGVLGWTGSGVENLEPANPVRLQAMRLQTARLDLPLRLLENPAEIELRDTDAQGRTVLRVAVDSTLYVDYHVDPKTYRITRMTMGMPGPPAMEFAAEYGLFHKIDGVLIAFKEVTFAGSTVTSEFQMTYFKWNPVALDAHLNPGATGVEEKDSDFR